ncbi:hypothetical protein PCCS19_29360 [Paenibacillus sp. CCS19]|uniref:hypothetical protein n=1 Tax=Paenibacillus sp. CCS19 TaxID=3158387 RepID=UPI0025644069|nr:hypothetical protein [Paenibacillus cellulosilyticus]GMK39881.1 hypothetical protein PCCS19_29360 [Paenibacillus cellulosilyticus]
MQVLKAIGTVVITIAVALAAAQWLPVKGDGTTVVQTPRTNVTENKAVNLVLPEEIQVDGESLRQHGYSAEAAHFSFDLTMDRFGKVKLVTVSLLNSSRNELKFILVDAEQNIVYELPDSIGELYGKYDYVSHVYMRDVNGDGLKDVIVIAQYKADDEKSDAADLPVAGVYFQTEDGFTTVDSIDRELNEKGITNNVAEVLGFLKRMQIEN